jgi:2-keto-4-pentenoate hydratase/2-oxohepta-3-ene-1,7-dioic acid hydratase in catechol pathway
MFYHRYKPDHRPKQKGREEHMAFVSFIAEGRTSYGIVRPDGVFDLGRRLGAALPDLRSFLTVLSGSGLDVRIATPKITDYATGQFTYLPIIPNPSKILCVGLNYEDHRVETGRKKADYPTLFTRFADTLTAHQTPMLLPASSSAFDYEGELAVIIGKHGFHVPEDQAMDIVAGFSVFNDGSIRDWQRHTNQFTPGKNFPSTAGFGPALITKEEAGPLAQKSLQTHLNGQLVQSAHLGDMIFSISQVIAYITAFTALSPGDIIATGTPGGVGFMREPPLFMRHGDSVTVTIEGIGTLTNTIESAGT